MTDDLLRAAFQASADQVIARLQERGERVPPILYQWGRLTPDEHDLLRARRRLTTDPDLRTALDEIYGAR